MSLFRQQPNVTLMTWGRCGSEDFLVAWVLTEQHKITCDWLSLAGCLKENYKCTASNKISMSFLFILYCAIESAGIAKFLIHITHALCTRAGIPLNNNEFPYVFKTVSRPFVFFMEMWAKLKGSLLEEPHLWTQDDAIKAGRHGKAKHQSELRGGSNKSENHSLLPRL